MSGIAGILHFDGAPVEHGQIEKMTSAMAHRGPDGIHHWVRGNVALGQCMLRTTPESLEETQPLTNEDESLVLVMDGRVDNWEELRRELLGRGAALRTRADTELVLRAYEVWGEACPDRIIGEYAFFIWDARQRRLFAARDAAGTRHFYYHAGRGWFAFASEIKGLLALNRIEPKLNESRVFDYLVPEFDRDDVVGTFYQDILRLPAGHAMTITERGVKTWRYWNPGDLSESHFASLDECAEAFLEQMRIAVKCRLRSIGPVGAMLSGGLDSSSIVGLIRKEFRNELSQPLRTFSLIREDRENCKDWEHIQPMLEGGWIEPTVITSARAAETFELLFESIRSTDEPFAFSHGLTYSVTYAAAREAGCKVLLDGIAGDVLFFGLDQSLRVLLATKHYSDIPTVLAAYRRHGYDDGPRKLARAILASSTPRLVGKLRQGLRDRHLPLTTETHRMLKVRRGEQAKNRDTPEHPGHVQRLARNFTTGLLSFAHEVYGQIAFSVGVEPRSPFSDRRLIEFAVRMPLQAKVSAPFYKHILRAAVHSALPKEICWRADIGQHPGWKFYEQFIARLAGDMKEAWNKPYVEQALGKWVARQWLSDEFTAHERSSAYSHGYNAFVLVVLTRWLAEHGLPETESTRLTRNKHAQAN